MLQTNLKDLGRILCGLIHRVSPHTYILKRRSTASSVIPHYFKEGKQIPLSGLAQAANTERTEIRKSTLEQLAASLEKPERHKTLSIPGAEIER